MDRPSIVVGRADKAVPSQWLMTGEGRGWGGGEVGVVRDWITTAVTVTVTVLGYFRVSLGANTEMVILIIVLCD